VQFLILILPFFYPATEDIINKCPGNRIFLIARFLNKGYWEREAVIRKNRQEKTADKENGPNIFRTEKELFPKELFLLQGCL
jgi:hypothetical protein